MVFLPGIEVHDLTTKDYEKTPKPLRCSRMHPRDESAVVKTSTACAVKARLKHEAEARQEQEEADAEMVEELDVEEQLHGNIRRLIESSVASLVLPQTYEDVHAQLLSLEQLVAFTLDAAGIVDRGERQVFFTMLDKTYDCRLENG